MFVHDDGCHACRSESARGWRPSIPTFRRTSQAVRVKTAREKRCEHENKRLIAYVGRNHVATLKGAVYRSSN